MKYLIIVCMLFVRLSLLAEGMHNCPTRTIEEVQDGIIVTYSFDKPEIIESEFYENAKYIRYDGFGLNDNDGEPCIPFRNDTYLVPNDVTITNSNVTIKADKVVIDSGTEINLGSILKVNTSH